MAPEDGAFMSDNIQLKGETALVPRVPASFDPVVSIASISESSWRRTRVGGRMVFAQKVLRERTQEIKNAHSLYVPLAVVSPFSRYIQPMSGFTR